ncbi:putative MFS multidrug transporter [Xylariales sp. PMI_506]|nr:putative MFS multidrug transporter [Xylariales sp. PMI_506]
MSQRSPQTDGPTVLEASPPTGGHEQERVITVEFAHDDPRNPQNFSVLKKWLVTSTMTMSVLAICLTSSAYSGSTNELKAQFNVSSEIEVLGVALFVLGFAVGPTLWAPLSELYGRRLIYVTTNGVVTALVAGAAGSQNIATMLVLRFLAGTFGASPLTNAGGAIADMFHHSERGIAMAAFSTAPFMGPVLGPILGGYISVHVGWRWVQGVCSCFIGVIWIFGCLTIPETYAPIILRKIAEKRTKETGNRHVSILEVKSGHVSPARLFATAFKRPWVLLFREPIVLIASTYLAILYGTIYMLLGAFPIVYQADRGWHEDNGSLPFLGVAVGMAFGLLYTILDARRYRKIAASATPEHRLPQAMVGAIALPIGMFAFAWTNSPNLPWAISVCVVAPFGFGTVLVFIACLNYLVDTYTVFAASVLAASAMLRSFFGFAFPMFTKQMYNNLGIHWASSIPAFLCVLCLPFPVIMHRYGAAIRMRCKYAHEAATILGHIQQTKDETDAAPTESGEDNGEDNISILIASLSHEAAIPL